MATRAIVMMSGDEKICNSIRSGLESQELKRLRAENAMLRHRDSMYWESKLHEARRKYRKIYQKRSRLYYWYQDRLAMWVGIQMLKEAQKAAKCPRR